MNKIILLIGLHLYGFLLHPEAVGVDIINDVYYQFGHAWTFLEDRLEIQ